MLDRALICRVEVPAPVGPPPMLDDESQAVPQVEASPVGADSKLAPVSDGV